MRKVQNNFTSQFGQQPGQEEQPKQTKSKKKPTKNKPLDIGEYVDYEEIK